MKLKKRFISIFMVMCLVLCNIQLLSASASSITLKDENISSLELQPITTNSCPGVPSYVYGAYDAIQAGNGWLYTNHAYGNTTAPYLPGGTTYQTYYMQGSARLVVGSNGSAFYSPNHYNSWISLF